MSSFQVTFSPGNSQKWQIKQNCNCKYLAAEDSEFLKAANTGLKEYLFAFITKPEKFKLIPGEKEAPTFK